MLQGGANKRQLKPQILQLKDLEKMYNELNQKIMQAEMVAMQMQQMAQQNAGLAGMGQNIPPGGGLGGPQGITGPMGIPMGPNAAGLGGPPAGQDFAGNPMLAGGGGQ
jgi:hypothetical protein